MLQQSKKYPYISILLIALVFAGSCTYKSKNILFKTKKRLRSHQAVLVVNPEKKDSGEVYRHRIKVGDRLLIRFLNNYDIGLKSSQSATASANLQAEDKGYLVNYDSTTTLPLIGRVRLIGLTRLEAAEKLQREYGKFIVNPIIDVNIASLSVTILGEVNTPGKIRVDKETTTIVDVIALSGGLKDIAKKQNAKIIRGNEVILVDLTNIDILKDPNIIIHDNDIIYIEPYGLKAASEPILAVSPAGAILISTTQLILIILQLYTFTQNLK